MEDNNKKHVLDAIYLCLRPIAEILLTAGIGQREAIEAMKLATVEVARSKYGIRKRPTNTSRIAVMTGLTRKEVKRLQFELERGERGHSAPAATSMRLLQKWQTEAEYLDEDGKPADLPFMGEKRSFTSLVKRCCADVPPGAMRKELRRMGCVATCRDDVVRYVGDDVVSNQLAEMFASDLAQLVAPMLASIAARDEFDGAKRDLVGNKQSRGVIRVEDVERVEKACERHLDGLIDAVGSMLDGYAMLHGEELKQADCKDLREVIVGAHLYTQVPTKDQTREEGPAGSGTPAKK